MNAADLAGEYHEDAICWAAFTEYQFASGTFVHDGRRRKLVDCRVGRVRPERRVPEYSPVALRHTLDIR
jgi:hypothetical protein